LLAALLCSWRSCVLAPFTPAQTTQELIDRGKNTDNVTTFGMGYRLDQYSPLDQINDRTSSASCTSWALTRTPLFLASGSSIRSEAASLRKSRPVAIDVAKPTDICGLHANKAKVLSISQ
jgi:hypothetical protein